MDERSTVIYADDFGDAGHKVVIWETPWDKHVVTFAYAAYNTATKEYRWYRQDSWLYSWNEV